MIGEKSKGVILRKDRNLIVQRAIFEMEYDLASDMVILDYLNQVTRSENFPIGRAEH
jgi:hypothetical protein